MQPEQVAKVRGDLGVTQQNMAVFSEMLSELKPGLEHPEVCNCQSSFKDLFFPGPLNVRGPSRHMSSNAEPSRRAD